MCSASCVRVCMDSCRETNVYLFWNMSIPHWMRCGVLLKLILILNTNLLFSNNFFQLHFIHLFVHSFVHSIVWNWIFMKSIRAQNSERDCQPLLINKYLHTPATSKPNSIAMPLCSQLVCVCVCMCVVCNVQCRICIVHLVMDSKYCKQKHGF